MCTTASHSKETTRSPHANSVVEAVYNWFGQNRLALNRDKTEAFNIDTSARRRHEAPITSVKMAGTEIKISESVKSLEVTIDSTLNLNKYIVSAVRVGSIICYLRHISKFINCDVARSLASALVRACIHYCL